MPHHCPVCLSALNHPSRGRKRKTCNDSCRNRRRIALRHKSQIPMSTTTERPKRELSDDELVLLTGLFRDKANHRVIRAFVTLTQEIPFGSKEGGKGPWNGDYEKLIPAGTVMRICMVSRFGDFGLSDRLDADYGYGVRLEFDDAAMGDLRREP
jgi:hypothetical protein